MKIKKDQDSRLNEELQECSFKPNITRESTSFLQQEDPDRTTASIADRNSLWAQRREQKLEVERQKAEREAIKECSFRPTIAGVVGRTASSNIVNTERLSQWSCEEERVDEDADLSGSDHRAISGQSYIRENRRHWDIVDRNSIVEHHYPASQQQQQAQWNEAVNSQDNKPSRRLQLVTHSNNHHHLQNNRVMNTDGGYKYKPSVNHFAEDDSEILSSAYELDFDMS